LILALVLLWLLVNWSKETSKEKRSIDFFDYFIQRYFYYFIIIFQDILLLFFFFWFNRGYNVNDRLDFVLTVIKQDYNANDRLKFILSFMRRDNGLNDRLKLVKNGRKENRKWTKWRWKLKKKQEMNWKSRIQKLTRWRTKKEWRTYEERWRKTKNLDGFAHGNVSEELRKHLGLDFLHGNNFFHPKQLKCIANGGWGYLEQPPFAYL